MRILILGGNGMLGHKLFQILSKSDPETYATLRRDTSKAPFNQIPFFQTDKVIANVEASDFDDLRSILVKIQPNWIINCIGIIKQNKEDMKAVPCITLNALLPRKLTEMASSINARLIHFSTDCVFDGKRGMYTEDDLPNASDIYGRTKFLGETDADNAITLRTSIIGRELFGHASLLDWFLAQKGTTKGFTNAIYSGVTTNQMAQVVQMIIEEHPSLNGLYQVVADPINKYDLLKMIKEIFDINIQIEPYDDFYMDRSMKGDKFEVATGYRSPDWPTLLHDLALESDLYNSWGIQL